MPTSVESAPGAGDRQLLTGAQVLAESLEDWRQLLGSLHARFEFGDFATGLALVQPIGEAAERADHHPDLDLRYGRLDVRLTSHDVGGITRRDVRLAREISALANAAGASARPEAAVVVELGLDTADADRVRPFWVAVLGAVGGAGSDEIVDPAGRLPTVWFQQTDPHDPPRQRFHLDVWVPHDLAEQRVESALAAGGTLVSDDRAPALWVLADADGNKACVCTWQDQAPDPM